VVCYIVKMGLFQIKANNIHTYNKLKKKYDMTSK